MLSRTRSTFGMRYRSGSGEITDRVVTLLSKSGTGSEERWVAYCQLRKAVRIFKPASAIAFYEVDTGVLLSRADIVGEEAGEGFAEQAIRTPKLLPPLKARAILFVDVETTGLSHDDRIVSLGAVKLRLTPPGEIVALHLIFNPERKCSRRATALHGYTNRTLARQPCFAPYARPLRAWAAEADMIVAHNAPFDLSFLNAAFARYDVPALDAPQTCTMRDARWRGFTRTDLDSLLGMMKLDRGSQHNALRDAWRCMQLFLWLRRLPWALDFAAVEDAGPANFFEPVRTTRKRAARIHAVGAAVFDVLRM
jgi:DNA polymerase III epsilon subunit-like protein